jgi:hypothetical protein
MALLVNCGRNAADAIALSDVMGPIKKDHGLGPDVEGHRDIPARREIRYLCGHSYCSESSLALVTDPAEAYAGFELLMAGWTVFTRSSKNSDTGSMPVTKR